MLVPTIGIEIHAELKSKAKVYSNSKNAFSVEANKNISLIDFGYPGTLPVLNREVIDMALKACLALHCKINKEMHWDRKNYFYPDLPKGFQITQQDTPIGYDGYVEIECNGKKKKIGIERIHIEEDTCKSIHSGNATKLNFNRAGVPLIEIVSKPDIESGEEASIYAETLRSILLYLGISDVKMEEGSMRCDTNVSLKEETSDTLGTKCEIKNIGSISNVKRSVDYEIKRQTKLIEEGKTLREETRRFDDKTGETILMRVKETGNDYRYFPEPDIPYVILTEEEIENVRKTLPVLPNVLRSKYKEVGMSEISINALLGNYELCNFLESIYENVNPVIAANLLTGDILSYMNREKLLLHDTKMTNSAFQELVLVLEKKEISSKQGKEILEILLTTGGDVKSIMKDNGMEQINDKDELLTMIDEVIKNNPESVIDYKDGRDRAVKYLMGQIMKASRGQANPQVVNELLLEQLKKY